MMSNLTSPPNTGSKVVVGEVIESAPAWAYEQYPDLLYVNADGRRLAAIMDGRSSTGGRHGLCLDHPRSRELAGRFLNELAQRYRGHPAMGAYDVQNEGFTPESALNCRCVRNTTAEPRRISLETEAFRGTGDGPEKSWRQEVNLAAGETKTVKLDEPWEELAPCGQLTRSFTACVLCCEKTGGRSMRKRGASVFVRCGSTAPSSALTVCG